MSCGSVRKGDPSTEVLGQVLANGRPFEGRSACIDRVGPFVADFKLQRELVPKLVALEAGMQRLPGDPGIAILLAMIWGKADQAVAAAREGVLSQPERAACHADLACALLYRARTTGDARDLAWALDAADQALALDAHLPAAQYNRALALERLQLISSARACYGALAQNKSLLGDEAAARLRVLDGMKIKGREEVRAEMADLLSLAAEEPLAQLIKAYPQDGREWAEGDLCEQWALELAEGRTSAPTTARIGLVADLLVAQGRDSALSQHLRVARSLSSAKAKTLAQALQRFLEGERAYANQDLELTGQLLTQALPVLVAYGSAFVLHARYRQAVCAYHQGKNQFVIDTFTPIVQGIDTHLHPALVARFYWILSLAHARLGGFDESVRCLTAARRLYDQLGERGNQGAILNLLSQSYDLLGMGAEAWVYRQQALAQQHYMEPRRRCNLLYVTSMGMERLGADSAALAVAMALVDCAKASESALLQSIALRLRGALRLDRKDARGARIDLETATAMSEKIRDPSSRAGVLRDVQLVRARLEVLEHPQLALQLLDEVERTSLSRESEHLLMDIYGTRIQCLLAMGDRAQAELTFGKGARFFERGRTRLESGSHRVAFQEAAARFFDQWIGLHGPNAEGLAIVERYRAQTLLEALGQEPGNLKLIQESLADGDLAIVFHQREKSLYRWVIGQGLIQGKELAIGRGELALKIDLWVNDLQKGRAQEMEEASQLFELILGRELSLPSSGGRWLIVPHDQLWTLPFGYLLDRRDRRRVLEQHVLVFAPSISTHQALGRRGRQLKPRLIALGNPKPQQAALQVSLLGSEAEAQAVASLYGGEVILGKDATLTSFKRALGEADILHYAGHAVSDQSGSCLLLTPEGNDDGRLRCDQLKPGDGSPELVVLSACATAQGDLRASEGPQSLATPFLEMGAPAVVVSLWPVDDRETCALMLRFHQCYRAGLAAPEALNQAILQMIAQKASPSTLAAFQVIGGDQKEARR